MTSNHKSLMLASTSETGRIRRFGFMRLPESLQDEIIGRLDRREITFRDAEQICRRHGHFLTREGIRAYYKTLTQERKGDELRKAAAHAINGLSGISGDDSVKGITGLLLSLLITSLEAHGGEARNVDLEGCLGIVARLSEIQTATKNQEASPPEPVIDEEARRKVIREVYGISFHSAE